MAVADIILGPAACYYAPVGEALPSDNSVGYGVAWGGNWVRLGYTKTPLSFNYTSEEFEAMVEEALGAVKRIKTKEDLLLETTLAELTADNLALGMDGTVTDTAAAAAQVGKEEMTMGGSGVLAEKAWGFEGLYQTSTGTQFPIRVFIYRATSKLNGALTFGKAEYPGIPLQIHAMEDLTKTLGQQLFLFQKVLAAHT